MFSSVDGASGGLRLKVVSYNIHRCFGTDRRYRPERVLEVLCHSGADIIALQEVDSSLEVDDGVDQLRYFARALKMHVVMGPTLRRHYGAYGNAFLSRLPFGAVQEVDLTYRKFEPRGLISTHVGIDGHQVRLINTHLGLKAWERRFQLNHVMSVIDWRSPNPVLMMGDFNEWLPWSRNRWLLHRSFGPTPAVRTFPSWWPRFALDRIYAYPRPREFRVHVLDAPGARSASDHLPIMAELKY